MREVTNQALCAAAIGIPSVGAIPAALLLGAGPLAVAGAFSGGFLLAWSRERRNIQTPLDEIPASASPAAREPLARTGLRAFILWPAPIVVAVAATLALGARFDCSWIGAFVGGIFALRAGLHVRATWRARLWERNWSRALYREHSPLKDWVERSA